MKLYLYTPVCMKHRGRTMSHKPQNLNAEHMLPNSLSLIMYLCS